MIVGEQVGPYEIKERIGQGGMATVFRAYQPSLSRAVALKVLSGVLSLDPSIKQRFHQEVLIAAALEHPNIVPIYDVGEQDGSSYIAMRLIPGQTLAELLQAAQKLNPQRAAYLCRQVALALDFAHSHGVIHRDVKPSNILVDADDHVYLSDFGIAQTIGATRLTHANTIVGTAQYMAPEQITGGAVDGRADVYSLGIVLFELITGKPPFARDNELAIMHAKLNDPVPSLPPEAASLKPIVEKALSRSASARYASAHAMADALTLPLPPLNPAPGPALTRGRNWVPIGAAIMAVVAMTTFLALPRLGDDVGPAPIEPTTAPLALDTIAEEVSSSEPITEPEPEAPAPGPAEPSRESLVKAAVDRANDAWADAKWTLQAVSCQKGLAGAELQACFKWLRDHSNQPRRANMIPPLTVLAMDGSSPNVVFVHTSETWFDDVYASRTRPPVRRDGPWSYFETYRVERIADAWVVTSIDISYA